MKKKRQKNCGHKYRLFFVLNEFKRAHIGKFLGIEDIPTSLNGLEKCEILTRQEFIPIRRATPGWSRPKDQQKKTDKFLSAFGLCMLL